MSFKILFSNIGYAKGINGALSQHILRFTKHFYSNLAEQQNVLSQLKTIMTTEQPDLCCFVEVDSGSFHSSYFNQLQALMDDEYAHHDIANKYGEGNPVANLPMYRGKSNAFLSKRGFAFERLYFSHGTKRLIYRLSLDDNRSLIFAHFSLSRKVRMKQFREVNQLVRDSKGEVIIMADFNIMQGFGELEPLLQDTDLKVLNKETEHTFIFHRRKLALDLCICSSALQDRANLRIIKQPFSDHAALLLEF